jgi:hypothetical protein
MKPIIRIEAHLPMPAVKLLIKEAKELKISRKKHIENVLVDRANDFQGRKLLEKFPNNEKQLS